jgi:hypothetical protein
MSNTKAKCAVDNRGHNGSEFANFTNLLDRLLGVPHSKIKAELDAEKRQKQSEKKRAAVGRAYRDSD